MGRLQNGRLRDGLQKRAKMQNPNKKQKANFINEAEHKKHNRKASKARIQEQK